MRVAQLAKATEMFLGPLRIWNPSRRLGESVLAEHVPISATHLRHLQHIAARRDAPKLIPVSFFEMNLKSANLYPHYQFMTPDPRCASCLILHVSNSSAFPNQVLVPNVAIPTGLLAPFLNFFISQLGAKIARPNGNYSALQRLPLPWIEFGGGEWWLPCCPEGLHI